MTEAEIWVQFMVGSLGGPAPSVEDAAEDADKALDQFLRRYDSTKDLTTGQVTWDPIDS